MTDAEGTRFLAEKVMGCEHIVRRASKAHVRLVLNDPSSTRFAVFDKKDGPIYLCGGSPGFDGSEFSPFTRIEHAFMLVPPMQKRGLSVHVIAHRDGVYCCMVEANSGEVSENYIAEAEGAVCARVICLAIMATIAALEGNNA